MIFTQEIVLKKPPLIMGILNVTAESFFSGTRANTEREITERATAIIEEGGYIIDVGGCSTNPYVKPVKAYLEEERLRFALPIIRRLYPKAVISVDTFRPEIAQMAIEEFGVQMINDVSGGCKEMYEVVGKAGAAYVLTSPKPTTDQALRIFSRRVKKLQRMGIKEIVLDPGFGFIKLWKRAADYERLRRIGEIKKAFPKQMLLAGISRKRMITDVFGKRDPECIEALHGTMLANFAALERGVDILRVHDVKEAAETIMMFQQIQ